MKLILISEIKINIRIMTNSTGIYSTNLNDYSFLIEGNSWNNMPLRFIENSKLRDHLIDMQIGAEFGDKMNLPFNSQSFGKIIANLITNTIYKLDVDTFNLVVQYMKLGSDINFSHPILHESAHQIKSNPKLFKAIWSHPKFRDFINYSKYTDKYGLNAKQRLAQSLHSLEYTLKNNLRVKSCETKYNDYGSILIPKLEEYTVEEHDLEDDDHHRHDVT
jgi:hypothetical protein